MKVRQLLAAVGLAVALGAGGAAAAEDPAPPAGGDSLTWAVSPVDKDGRSRPTFEYDVEPGEVVDDALHVRVIGPNDMDFDVYGSDALLTEEGVFDVLPAAKPSRDVGSWVAMATDHVEVGGDGGVDIPFTLTVPENATPGDHIGGIVTSVSTQADAGEAGSIRLDRRLGARIYLRVAGELKPGVTISEPVVSYEQSPNPFGGRTKVSYSITNSGNTRVQATRSVTAGGLLGGSTGRRDLPELLPGSVLSFTETVPGPRLLGPATATVRVEGRDKLPGELPTSGFEAVDAGARTWALSWSQLGLLLLLCAAAALAFARRREPASAAPGMPGPAGPRGPDAADVVRPADRPSNAG